MRANVSKLIFQSGIAKIEALMSFKRQGYIYTKSELG